jgi:uncharacterized protein (UPF0276 family)
LSGIAGIGIGLRKPFAAALLESERKVDWLEVTPENWVFFGGRARRLLDACAERWQVVPHSVSLDVGGSGPLDPVFLDAIAGLVKRTRAPFWSDHLCYSSVHGRPLHDLLPLPFSQEALDNAAGRARRSQDRVGAPLVLENATYYAVMPGSVMDEASFLCAAAAQSGCRLLLDANNVYVNGQNHGFDPYAFIDRMPLDRVEQLHVAGHTHREELIIDTHIGPVPDPVWDLYRYTLRRAGRLIPTLIEWDAEIPPLDVVLDEVDRARAHAAVALAPAGSEARP